MGMNCKLRKCVFFIFNIMEWLGKILSETLWKFIKNSKIFTVLHLFFYSHSPKYQELNRKQFKVGKLFWYDVAHLVKASNLALLDILVQLVQNLNQNVSKKHPIRIFFKNPTPSPKTIKKNKKIKKCPIKFQESFGH